MSKELALILEEYKISKDAIKSVMSQLSTVTASLLALSGVIFQFGLGDFDRSTQILFWYMVLLLLNYLITYAVYQNVQITALQRHIARLEQRLGGRDIFRWESVIARAWYEGRGLRANILNILLAAPPVVLIALVYVGLGSRTGFGKMVFCFPLVANLLYFVALWIGFRHVRAEVSRLDSTLSTRQEIAG